MMKVNMKQLTHVAHTARQVLKRNLSERIPDECTCES